MPSGYLRQNLDSLSGGGTVFLRPMLRWLQCRGETRSVAWSRRNEREEGKRERCKCKEMVDFRLVSHRLEWMLDRRHRIVHPVNPAASLPVAHPNPSLD